MAPKLALLVAFLVGRGVSLCNDDCRHSLDNECDDGSPGASYSYCTFGTDCTDCLSPAPNAYPTAYPTAYSPFAFGDVRDTLTGHTSDVDSVAFAPGGDILASGSSDNSIKLWTVSTGILLKTLTGHTSYVVSVAFAPGGDILASGSYDNSIKLWTWKVIMGSPFVILLKILTGHTDSVYSVAFAPGGDILASGSADNSIKLWTVSTGSLLKTLTGHTSGVDSVAFAPGGDILASGSRDKSIKLWTVSTGSLLKTLTGHTSGVLSVAFAPGGDILASGSWDNSIKLWTVSTGSLLKTLTGHTSDVHSVAFAPGGDILASGSYDRSIKLWTVSTGSLLKTLTGHTSGVRSVAFAPGGDILASGSGDSSIKLWTPSPTASPTPSPTLSPTPMDPCQAGYYCPEGVQCFAGGLTSDCLACSPGQFSLSNTEGEKCRLCPVGKFSGPAGSSQCTACPVGQTGTARGKTSVASGCFSCPAGQYSISGADCSGMPCAPGKYGTAGATAKDAPCYDCPAGQYQPKEGKDVCEKCRSGLAASNEGSAACEQGLICKPGHFGSLGNTVAEPCLQCGVGKFTDTEGSESCTTCGGMTYQNQAGQALCKKSSCVRGEYSLYSPVNDSKCQQCPMNYYRSANMASCEETTCPEGSFSPAGATRKENDCIIACGSKRRNSALDISSGFCECNTGLYSKGDGRACDEYDTANNTKKLAGKCECHALPEGVSACSKLSGCTPEAFITKPGFWRASMASTELIECPVADMCLGPSPAPSFLSNSSSAAVACREGHTGLMCSVCDDSWIQKTDHLCHKCEDADNTLRFVGLAVVFCVIPSLVLLYQQCKHRIECSSSIQAAVSKMMRDNQDNQDNRAVVFGCFGHKLVVPNHWRSRLSIKVKILLAFMQVISQIDQVYKIPYPAEFVAMVRSIGFVDLDMLSIFRFGCIVPFNFYLELVAVTLTPIILVVLISVAVKLGARCMTAEKACAAQQVRIEATMLLTFVVFPSVSTKIFKTFPCHTFDDGTIMLTADYSISCQSSNRPLWLAYAALMVLIYPVGITILYACVLWQQRHQICPDEMRWSGVWLPWFKRRREDTSRCWGYFRCPHIKHLELFPPRQKSDAADLTLLQRREEIATKHSQMQVLQFLYKEYKPRFWWFEVFECLRRVMMTGGTVFFLEGSATQIVIGMLVSLASVVLYSQCDPYIDDHDDQLAMTAQLGIFFTLFAGLLCKCQVPAEDGYSLGAMLIIINLFVIGTAVYHSLVVFYDATDKDEVRGSSEKDDNEPTETKGALAREQMNPMTTQLGSAIEQGNGTKKVTL